MKSRLPLGILAAISAIMLSGCAWEAELQRKYDEFNAHIPPAERGSVEDQAILCNGYMSLDYRDHQLADQWCPRAIRGGSIDAMKDWAWSFHFRSRDADAAYWMTEYEKNVRHPEGKAYGAKWGARFREEAASRGESFQWGKFAAISAGVMIGGQGLSDSHKASIIAGAAQDSQAGVKGDRNTQGSINNVRTQVEFDRQTNAQSRARDETASAKEAEAANNRRMMDDSIRSHQPSAQNATNRQQPPVQPWNNQANRSANSNANLSRNAGNTQIALNQNGVRADSSSDNENWKSAFTPKLSWADCEKRAKELHGRCDRAEIFKPAFTAADRSAAEQSKLCSETKNRALNSNFYAIVEDLGCGCYLHEGNLHCTYFTIGKSRHKSVGGGKSK